MEYEVKLEIFEGPLDLLLHLIHKNELDIFDIPIATITDQYLAYLDLMKAMNINVAGDFLVMASTLTYIKSKMLLPEFQEDNEEEDPRVEITRPLLEYMRFKEIAAELSERELLTRDVFSRPVIEDFLNLAEVGEQRLDVNLFQLMDAFKRIVEKELPGTQLQFESDKWTVKEKTQAILASLKDQGPLFFQELFRGDKTVSEFIVTFLALLELVHLGVVRIFQAGPESDIRLTFCPEAQRDSHVG